MDMLNRFFGPFPTLMGRGVIGTSRLAVYDLIQAIDWPAIFDAGYALDVSSSSANDAAGNTGARTIEVYGLDNAGNPLVETITLNGQTKVTGAKSFWRVFGARVITAGTGRVNAGDIYILKTGTGGTYSGGVPPTLTSAAVKILVGNNFGSSGIWTAPRGTIYTLDQFVPSCRAQAGLIEIVHAGARAATPILPYAAVSYDLGIGSPAWLDYHEGSDYILQLNELEDIWCRATMAAASGIVAFVAKLTRVSPAAIMGI